MDQYAKRHAVFMHQQAKIREIMDHEAKMYYFMLDRSHYRRAALLLSLAYTRYQMKFHTNQWRRKQLMWEWRVHYVHLRLCFKSPLPWEANRYCRWL